MGWCCHTLDYILQCIGFVLNQIMAQKKMILDETLDFQLALSLCTAQIQKMG